MHSVENAVIRFSFYINIKGKAFASFLQKNKDFPFTSSKIWNLVFRRLIKNLVVCWNVEEQEFQYAADGAVCVRCNPLIIL
jgi:hypothetical protein